MKHFVFKIITLSFLYSHPVTAYSMQLFSNRRSNCANNSWQLSETVSLSVGTRVGQSHMRGTIDFAGEQQRTVNVIKIIPTYTGPTAIQLRQDRAELQFKHHTVPITLLNKEQLNAQQRLFAETIINEDQNEHQSLQSEEQETRTHTRIQAFETNQRPYEQTFSISHQSKELIKAAHCTPEQFTMLFGSPVQHLLHQELVNAVECTADTYQTYKNSEPIVEQCVQVVQFADLGLRANWSGNLALGFQISDWCWHASKRIGEIAHAVVSGIVDATENAPHLIVIAGIGKLIGAVPCGRIVLAISLLPDTLKLLKTAHKGMDLYFRSTTLDPQAEKDFQEFLQPIKETIARAKQIGRYATWQSFLNIFRTATAVTAQFYIQRRLAGDIKKSYNRAQTALKRAIKKGVSCQELRACTIPGGTNVQFAQQNNNFFAKKNDTPTKPSLTTSVVNAAIKPIDIRSFGGKQGFYIFKKKRVNVFYEPKKEKWWAKDLARHGGSHYKVFKQEGNYLIWQFDADEFGNTIIGKHKGPKGLKVKLFGA